MIKNLNHRKLSRTSGHRRAMLRNMAVSLFQHEKIKTTLPKAKELASYSEKLISLAKPATLLARRNISREIKIKDIQKKIFETLITRYQDRSGGTAGHGAGDPDRVGGAPGRADAAGDAALADVRLRRGVLLELSGP